MDATLEGGIQPTAVLYLEHLPCGEFTDKILHYQEKLSLAMIKALKLIGNLGVILAFLFVGSRIAKLDISFKLLCSSEICIAFAVCIVIQVLLLIMACYPWNQFIRILSSKKIPFLRAMTVCAKSNIYKYIPGNVFQYVGRNKLASDMSISHIDVASATLLDIFFYIIFAGVFSVLLLGSSIQRMLTEYGANFIKVGIFLGFAMLIVVLLFIIFRKKCRQFLSRYIRFFLPGNRGAVIKGVLYYPIQYLINVAMFALVLWLTFKSTDEAIAFSQVLSLSGAFVFAWLIGFVTPGAPGGIGIRESVMLFMCQKEAWQDEILLFVLLQRVASIIADVIAFLIGACVERKISR